VTGDRAESRAMGGPTRGEGGDGRVAADAAVELQNRSRIYVAAQVYT